MNIVNTLIIAFLIFTLIWLARDFLMCQYWEFRWFHITGHSWKEDDDKVRDRALAEMARTGDKDRFDRARDLALKLDTGHAWHGRERRIEGFDHYAKL